MKMENLSIIRTTGPSSDEENSAIVSALLHVISDEENSIVFLAKPQLYNHAQKPLSHFMKMENLSIIRTTGPSSDEENSAIVSALLHVISGDTNTAPTVVTGETSHFQLTLPEQEKCRRCEIPDCLGCRYFSGSSNGDEGRRKRQKKLFIGARQRPSGKWGSEIMDPRTKERKWLGTFNSSEEAARAYDIANIGYRGKTAKTNFPVEEYPEVLAGKDGYLNPNTVGRDDSSSKQ